MRLQDLKRTWAWYGLPAIITSVIVLLVAISWNVNIQNLAGQNDNAKTTNSERDFQSHGLPGFEDVPGESEVVPAEHSQALGET